MGTLLARFAPLATVLAVLGCANMHVKKVSLESRMDGKDEKIKGFRYYLSRPYLVVKAKVPIAVTQEYTRLVSVKNVVDSKKKSCKALEALVAYDSQTTRKLYDLQGGELDTAQWVVEAVYTVATLQTAVQITTGRVTKIDKNALTVKVAGKDTTITVPADAKVTIDDNDSKLVGIKAGQLVIITTKGGVITKVEAYNLPAPPVLPEQTGADLNPAALQIVIPPITPVVPPAKTESADGKLVVGPAQNKPTDNPGGDGVPAPDVIRENIQVVSLPDFEEQYAIRNQNFLATGKYELHFTDGWALDSTAGNWNATQVPVRILQSLQNTIKAFSSFQAKAITDLQGGGGAPKTAHDMAADEALRRPSRTDYIVVITRTFVLEPGIYRLQKSWEKQDSDCVTPGPDHVCGLLTSLGLEVHQEVSIKEGTLSPNP